MQEKQAILNAVIRRIGGLEVMRLARVCLLVVIRRIGGLEVTYF